MHVVGDCDIELDLTLKRDRLDGQALDSARSCSPQDMLGCAVTLKSHMGNGGLVIHPHTSVHQELTVPVLMVSGTPANREVSACVFLISREREETQTLKHQLITLLLRNGTYWQKQVPWSGLTSMG